MRKNAVKAKKVDLAERIITLVEEAKRKVVSAVNVALVYTYYEVGRMIVEEEQGGRKRAQYGKAQLQELSKKLTAQLGKGFSVDNLQNMRNFYIAYSPTEICEKPSRKLTERKYETVSRKSSGQQNRNRAAEINDGSAGLVRPIPKFTLSWSHYLKLMRIDDPDERRFYEIEAAENRWGLKELQRQFDSALYQRLALSRDKTKVLSLAKRGQLLEKPADVIKEPYVLEFLGLPEQATYSESELEQRLIGHLSEFLLELGKGFAFVGRQVRITFDEHHFWIDLVFYNRLLRCFVLFDLKIGELKHQDIGQMQMYVNYYDRMVKMPEENPTIGILLCADKNDAIVEMTLPQGPKRIFASKYMTVLPDKETLRLLVRKQMEAASGASR